MQNKLFNNCFFVLSITIFTSCSSIKIEKRSFKKGYYIDFQSNKYQNKKTTIDKSFQKLNGDYNETKLEFSEDTIILEENDLAKISNEIQDITNEKEKNILSKNVKSNEIENTFLIRNKIKIEKHNVYSKTKYEPEKEKPKKGILFKFLVFLLFILVFYLFMFPIFFLIALIFTILSYSKFINPFLFTAVFGLISLFINWVVTSKFAEIWFKIFKSENRKMLRFKLIVFTFLSIITLSIAYLTASTFVF